MVSRLHFCRATDHARGKLLLVAGDLIKSRKCNRDKKRYVARDPHEVHRFNNYVIA